MNCTVCGHKVHDNATYCSHCGYVILPECEQIYPPKEDSYNKFDNPKKKNKSQRITLGVLLFSLTAVATTIIILLISGTNADHSSCEGIIQSFFDSITDNDIDILLDTLYPAIITAKSELGYTKEEIYQQTRLSTLYKLDDYSINFANMSITYSGPDYEHLLRPDIEVLLDYDERYPYITSILNVKGTIDMTIIDSSETENAKRNVSWDALVVYADSDYYIVDIDLNH